MKRNTIRWMLMIFLAGIFAVSSSLAKETPASKPSERIPRPKDGVFIVDLANIIDPLNEEEINNILMSLQEETGVTLYVVIVSHLSEMGFENPDIEAVARELMKEWKIGPETLDGKPWDRGVLFLINRKMDQFQFRVEMARGWGKDLDEPALTVIQRDIFPYFHKKKYSLGLSRGIRSLQAAIRRQTRMRTIPPKIASPKQEEYVLDTASLMPLEVKLIADKLCRKLYENHTVPMFVVTTPSIETLSRKGITFDIVAKRFFQAWSMEPEARCRAFRDRGVLLFISRDENLVGMKFADAWGDRDTRNRLQKDIIINNMTPSLNAGNLPQAVINGIQGVQKVAEKKKFPTEKTPPTTAPSAAPAAKPQ